MFSIDRVPLVPNSPGPLHRLHEGDRQQADRRPVHAAPQVRGAVSAGAERPVDDLHRVEEGGGQRHDRGLQQRQGGHRQRPLQVRPLRERRPHRARAQRQLLGRQAGLGQGHVQDHQERAVARGGAAVRRRRRDGRRAHGRPGAAQGRPEVQCHVEDLAPRDLFQLRLPRPLEPVHHRQGRQAAREESAARRPRAARDLARRSTGRRSPSA